MRKIIFIFIPVFFCLSCATGPQIKNDNLDLTFIRLKNYLGDHPDSPHAQKIRFGLAEYYFQINDYKDAIEELTSYINDYSPDKKAVFAYFLLYKIISENYQNTDILQKIKEKFFSKSLFLMFGEVKTHSYRSIFNNIYKAYEHIDKIEVYRNDDLFLQLTP